MKEKRKAFLTGSAAFFSCYKDYRTSDIDIIELKDNIPNVKTHLSTFDVDVGPSDVFIYCKKTPEEYIDFLLKELKINELGYDSVNKPMHIAAFLTPTFCDEIGFTINDLKKIKPVSEVLDNRHKYLKIIYDYYILNNGFFLTDSQRLEAYTEYKKERDIL
jgi:hypothetical protein